MKKKSASRSSFFIPLALGLVLLLFGLSIGLLAQGPNTPAAFTPSNSTPSARGGMGMAYDPGREEVVAWAFERPDGGRGFGFTGAHFHKNWANDDFRRLVVNAILWSAHVEVPPGGAKVDIDPIDLNSNLDRKPGRRGG